MRARRVAHATVCAVIASLIELLLSQPFHASERCAARGGAPALVAAGPVSGLATAHDADLCSMCRATAQTRLGLRAALRFGVIAADRPCLALHLPAEAPVKAAPPLRQAQPRAPPSFLPLISA